MLQINLKLSWKQNIADTGPLRELEGVWGYASYLISEDDLIEKACIDEDMIIYDKQHSWEWIEFTSQHPDTCTLIGIWVEDKGNLPVGIPLCIELGLPCHIDFLDYEVVEDEEDV